MTMLTQPNYGYLSGYRSNKNQKNELIIDDFETQVKFLHGHFNCGMKFNPDWIVRTHAVAPDWVEKFFAQFDWRLIAKTYGEAVELVLKKLKETRNGAFYNYCEGELGPGQLRQLQKSIVLFEGLDSSQKVDGVKCNVVATPAQFGVRHRGRSVRRVREVLSGNEFGLGAFAVGSMLLTHPKRLAHNDDLWIDCAGDEFAPIAYGGFSKSPFFHSNDDKLKFDAGVVSHAFALCGSVSGFLPR